MCACKIGTWSEREKIECLISRRNNNNRAGKRRPHNRMNARLQYSAGIVGAVDSLDLIIFFRKWRKEQLDRAQWYIIQRAQKLVRSLISAVEDTRAVSISIVVIRSISSECCFFFFHKL